MKNKFKLFMTGLVITSPNANAIIDEEPSIEERINTVRKSIVRKIDNFHNQMYKLEFDNGSASKLSNEEKTLLTWANWGNGWNNWVDWNDWNNWGDWGDWSDFSNVRRWGNY